MTGADLRWPLDRAAALYGDQIAVTADEWSITYGQLAVRTAALGAGLTALGIVPQERVAVLGANSAAHLECWLGIPASGRVIADLNTRLAVDELAFLIDDCEARLLIHDAANSGVAAELRERCPTLETLVLDGRVTSRSDATTYAELLGTGEVPATSEPEIGADTLAAISYTGGTTGRPKGVMLSHGNLATNALHNLIVTKHRADDVFLHVCPMFHVAGIANVFAATWAGARQVVLPRFDAGAVARVIEAEQVTLTTLVPTMLARLLDHLEETPSDLSSLRNLHYAASPISPELQRRVCETLSCEIAQMYGMTEAAPSVTTLSPEVHRRGLAGHEPERGRLASMGVPIVGVSAEIRDSNGVRAPTGQIGEVWVRGPNVMLGYWGRSEATAAALVDGWYRTGDAAYADVDGYLFMVDRLKDMIISGGENVYSIEVEHALVEADGVLEAAVFGVPDPQWGERVHAAVVLDPTAQWTEDALREHCRERIAGFKVPRSWTFRSEPLPKSGAGKILKTTLREPFWADAGRRVG